MRLRDHVQYWKYSFRLFWEEAWDWSFHTFLDFSGTDEEEETPFKLQIYQDAIKEWRWRLVSSKGRIICVASEGYKTKQGVVTALKLARSKIVNAVVE